VAAADREFPGSAALAIRWERDDPDRQELRLRSTAPAFLVVADAEFPGWTARLDGVRVDIERVDLVLRGVTIPAGEHRLSLDYVPEGWTLARVLSIAAWAAACAGLVALAAARIVRPRVAPMTPSG